MFFIDTAWHSLGPFGIGTREDPWKDSVSIHDIQPSDTLFPSTLCAAASWNPIEAIKVSTTDDAVVFRLELTYPDIDWKDLNKTYGWASSQFDAFVVGRFSVDEDCTAALQVRNSPEFLLDGVRYEGDIYSIGKPRLISLTAGVHLLQIRVINEIRIFGYRETVLACVIVHLDIVRKHTSKLSYEMELSPDHINEGSQTKLSSAYESYRISNTTDVCIRILSMYRHLDPGHDIRVVSEPLIIAAKQSRSIVIKNDISHRSDLQGLISTVWTPTKSSPSGSEGVYVETVGSLRSRRNYGRLKYDPHTITYLNIDNTIGSAILRAPSSEGRTSGSGQKSLPVILAFHGAGVDIESPAWKNLYENSYHAAWILQPSCGTWGDDWHSLSALSIECALKAIGEWIQSHDYQGPTADLKKILVMGHSNGGQGAMQWIVRNSDRIIGAAWAAGYTSISRYVPYSCWSSNSLALVERLEYDVVRNISMFAGVKCFVRHGEKDDNVPIYHSRLMASLTDEIEIEQVPAEGHWYDGILTEGRIKAFVDNRLSECISSVADRFTIISWGRPMLKGGIMITRLEDEYGLPASLSVVYASGIVKITTKGVRSWTCLDAAMYPNAQLELNGQDRGSFKDFVQWTGTLPIYDRRDLTAILETRGPISIVNEYPAIFGKSNNFELRIAQSLDLYHSLDAEIVSGEIVPSNNCNAIVLRATKTPDMMGIWLRQDGPRAIAVLIAATAEQMSRLIRLLPWRTGTGVPGCFWMDDSSGAPKVTYASDVDFEIQLDQIPGRRRL